MDIPRELYYSKTHEWVRVEGNIGVVGITSYAAHQLGDVVYVELPEVGRELRQGEAFAVVESVKAVSDCYAPVSGRVVAVNDELIKSPELLNEDAFGQGWMIKVELSDTGELASLLDADGYLKVLQEEGHAT